MNQNSALPFNQWPAADQACWQAATQDGGLFDARGKAAHWSSRTRREVKWIYGRWLNFIKQNKAAAWQLSPAERFTQQLMAAFSQRLIGQISLGSVSSYLNHLALACRAMSPGVDHQFILKIAAQIHRQSDGPVRDKRAKLHDVRVLFQLGCDLMDSVEGLGGSATLPDWLQFRDGLVIALLATRPLRRRTLSLIRLGQHLQHHNGTWYLLFTAEETKQRRPLEFALPSLLEPYLQTYLSEVRPRLLGDHDDDHLWISARGRGLSDSRLYERVCHHTEAALGVRINLHLFRDCAATTLANEDPDHVLAVAPLLGHADLKTADRHYIHAQSRQAARRYQETLSGLRQKYSSYREKK
ncbi:MAG: tyrosine-type recombinase/integrase [Candidatus Thiodiazotropha sp. 'RUGA']|nr:tyrosine-type recombinase/integrase [Candidatus Thiodiazotropha sp. 'RUGA']